MSSFGSVLGSLILLCAVFWLVRWRRELKKERIFEMVEQKQLTPSAAGVVCLPASLSSASRDGKAYVTRRGDLLMVFLPAWFGKASNIQGALMCNRTLTPEDVESDTQFGGTTIKIVYPLWLSFHGPRGPATGLIFIEGLEQNRRGRIKRYQVFNNLS